MISWHKVDELMQQEVSRKDFLRYVGLALLSMVGISSMLQNIQTSLGGHDAKADSRRQTSGYGSSAYGR